MERAKYVKNAVSINMLCESKQFGLARKNLHVCPESSFQTPKNTTSLILVILNLGVI